MIFFRAAIVLLLGLSLSVAAEEAAPRLSQPEELLSEGLKHYESGRYPEAAKAFSLLNTQRPNQPAVLLNWGLAEYQAGRRGLAVGAWRRALAIAPAFQPARAALEFATRAMQLRDVEDSLWLERVRHGVLAHVTLHQLLGLCLILLAAGGWPLVSYLARRRRALRDELPLPAFSWVGAGLGLVFLLAMTLTVLKGIEWSIPRATAVSGISVRSAPSAESSSLFELREGSDVILRQATKGWTQIRYPGGMSGWVPQEALFQTSGMPLW